MDIRQQSIIKYSNTILEYLLKFKETHPDFTFSLRQRDFAKADSPKRLENGQWFQGSDYIFVPLFKIGDSNRKIKTFGFALNFDKNGNITSSTITISFKGGVTNRNDINFHKSLAKEIGIELNHANCGDYFFDNPKDITKNLDYYLNNIRPIALRLLEEYKLLDKYVYSEAEFQKYLERINEIRNNNSLNYWIFQGSPKIYDTVNALQNNAISTWTVSAHRDRIKNGDKFILWLTGTNAGCYALGTIISDVAMMKEGNTEMSYYLSPTQQIENYRVKIRIDKNFAVNPILWNDIKNEEVFKNFKGGNQGTNFTATLDEYNYFNSMPKTQLERIIDIYIKDCKTTNWLDNELYKFEWAKWIHDKVNFDEISSDAVIYQIALDSQKVAFTGSTGVQFIKQGAREQMSKYIGIDDIRYFREFNDGKTLSEIGFEHRNMSFPIVSCYLATFFPDKIYPVSRTSFADVIRKLFNANVNNSNIGFIESLQHYCQQIDTKLKASVDYETILKNKLQFNELSQLEYNWAVQDFLLYVDRHPELLNTTTITQTNNTMSEANLNQILFGPPGTGKTYNSINKAIEIINPSFDLSQDRGKVKKEFDQLVAEGQIVFTTFHQSTSYEDFIEGIKPKIDEDANENKQVIYEIEDGIFKRLVEKAKKVKTTSKEVIENYSFDDAWDDLVNEAQKDLENNTPLFLSIQTPNLGLKIIEITERGNLKLKPIYSEDAKEYTVSYSRAKKLQEAFPDLSVVKNIDKEFRAVIGGSNSTAYWAILNYINQKISSNSKVINQESKLPALPHVLIIDEINRGNVSQIFGELITLIEKDKRIGNEEALEVILPYSKEKFGVPANLYIIGTMNTADRSVEALDTALRRRFSFTEMMPDEKVIIDKNFTDYDRVAILQKINQRIEVLLDRNYTLGHSYFIKEDFKNSFENEIIPLMQEYFYNDYGKIGLVLGKGFVREKAITVGNKKSIFADFETKSEVDIVKSYELIPFNEVEFDTAIQLLLA